MPLRVLPDAEQLIQDYLRSHTELQAIVGSDPVRIYTRIPEAPVYPLLTQHRSGGRERLEQHLDAPHILVSSWADTKKVARDLAATALAALHVMPGTHPLGVVTDVETTLGLQWLPDDSVTPWRPRYVFEVRVTLHPRETAPP